MIVAMLLQSLALIIAALAPVPPPADGRARWLVLCLAVAAMILTLLDVTGVLVLRAAR